MIAIVVRTSAWILLGLVVIAGAGLGYLRWKIHIHSSQYERMTAGFEALRFRRPLEISAAEWDHQLRWLHNLAGNCLCVDRYVPTRTLGQLADDLERRIAGEVDLRTVDWIWDEVARVSTIGPGYSERFRPTSTKARLRDGFEVAPSTVVERTW